MSRHSQKQRRSSARHLLRRRSVTMVKRTRKSAKYIIATVHSNDFRHKTFLPVLQYSNVRNYPKWHEYVQRVYKEGVRTTTVDLNRFTWFYYNAPFETKPVYRTQNLCIPWENSGDVQTNVWLGNLALRYNKMTSQRKELLRLKENDAFVGLFKYILSSSLLRRATNYGFFVHHKSFTIDYIRNKILRQKRVEVLHVKEERVASTTWFWLVKGSGIFLDVSFARSVKIVQNRLDLHTLYRDAQSQAEVDTIDTTLLQDYMDKQSIDIVVFFEANGIPEMIVRHPEVNNKKTFCLPQKLFYTGLDGKLFVNHNTHTDFPILNLTSLEQPPVWFTESEHVLYKSLMVGSDKLHAHLNYFIAIYGVDVFRRLLYKWFPIWYYHPRLQRWIDCIATPLLFAYVKNDDALVRFIEQHEPIAPQLACVHPHHLGVTVNDVLFSFGSIYPELATVPCAVNTHIYIEVPYVSQHFWHFMMGEFLPVVATILKFSARRVCLIKRNFHNCPFNAFYHELHVEISFVKRAPDDANIQKIHEPNNWNYYNQGEKHLLIKAVEYLKEWATAENTLSSSASSQIDYQNRSSCIVLQDRISHAPLVEYFKNDFAKEYKKATYEVVDNFLHSTHSQHCNTTSHHKYGAQRRCIQNMKELSKVVAKRFPNAKVHYQVDDHLSLRNQILPYSEANTLILGHGAGMLHILWMPANSTVIEIIPKKRLVRDDGYLDGCKRLCDLLGFRLQRIIVHDNYAVVDEDAVLKALESHN